MSAPLVLPEPLLAHFRAASFERLERIDATWAALTQGSAESKADDEMFRELHTLKGDARVVGFTDVATLCQRLEDLLAAARGRKYRVHEDVDVVVTMAIQFVGMLLRKKAGMTRGIDLEGFLAQIEVVLDEWLRQSSAPPPPASSGVQRHVHAEAGTRFVVSACDRLGVAATTVYLEHLRTSGSSRERLRGVWAALAAEIAALETGPLEAILTRHAASARALSCDLGKLVEVFVEGAELRVDAEVGEALNTAVLHAVRNAIDHGLDSRDARKRAGKPPSGTLRLRARQQGDLIEIEVADDGAGVDFDAVQKKAARLGLPVAQNEAALTELLFAPGFSTRDEVTELSGRGIGLDALRATVRRLGGDAHMESTRGLGTTLRFSVPNRRAPVDVRVFRSPCAPLWLAVDAAWQPCGSDPEFAAPVEALALLDIPRSVPAVAGVPLTLRREGRQCAFVAEAPSRVTSAARLCRTPDDFGVEIVRLAEGEALLLRPEALLDRMTLEVANA